MKTFTKTGVAAFMLFTAISCTKTANSPSQKPVTASDKSESTAAFTIGQSYHGGIIFYIDGTGQHGLIAAKTEWTGIAWKKGPNMITNATGVAVGTGRANTRKIVTAHGTTGKYAALLCYNYSVGAYSNWYLPSKNELNLLYQQKNILGISGQYWSSSEVSKGKAWDQEFGGGYQFKDSKYFTLSVRAISSF